MATKLSELTEATSVADADIFHVRTSGGIDKKITKVNLFNALVLSGQAAAVYKGWSTIQLTEYDTDTQPEIAANCACEINGIIYTNTSAISITGSTSNNTWYDILLTPSGGSYLASFVARNTGVWSESKGGLYSGDNRVIGCVYKDGSGNFLSKNVFNIINRTIEIKIEIRGWNVDTDVEFEIRHGLSSLTNIRDVEAIIRNNAGTLFYKVSAFANSVAAIGDLTFGHVTGSDEIYDSTYVYIRRSNGCALDNSGFNSTTATRGHLYLIYEV